MITVLFSICLLGLSKPSWQAPTSAAVTPSDSAVIEQFAAAVSQYLALRGGVTKEVPGLRVTDNAAEIASRSDALARAIQRSRGNAPQGHFFNAKLVGLLRTRLRDVGARPDVRAAVMPEGEEKPTVGAVRVHTRFPGPSPMTTVPTVLLDALPPLPRELEYRFVGTTLVLRDIEAALILDYATGVLPPEPRK